MFGKTAAVLLVVFGVYLIGLDALKCYSYHGAPNKTAELKVKIDCNATYSNATVDMLKVVLGEDIKFNSTKASCTTFQYNKTADEKWIYKGCTYEDVNPCKLKAKSNATFATSCKHCSKDLCNPAGRSVAQFSVIGISSILVFLMKMF